MGKGNLRLHKPFLFSDLVIPATPRLTKSFIPNAFNLASCQADPATLSSPGQVQTLETSSCTIHSKFPV